MIPLEGEDAYRYIEFATMRFFGWQIVLASMDGRIDGRTRAARAAFELHQDIIFNRASFDDLVTAIEAGRDIVEMWPDPLREVVRFQLEHKVSRAVNEPTSAEFAASMIAGGRADWLLPAALVDHGEPATVADHPPIPDRSPVFVAWDQHRQEERAAARLGLNGTAA